MTTAARTLNLGTRAIPFTLPNRRDARLHTAAVIISIHTIGLLALGFRVSVPQILSAILTAAILDVTVTYARSGVLVWPASGMLTGSGVALILRLVGMGSGEYWSWEGWYWYSLVAGVSLATKFVIRWRGEHIFNPSNVGLVAAFLIIGSGVVEPLDFWWAPMGPWMVAVYAIIIGGGIIITRRLHLLEMAVVYWLTFALGQGILAASGHCMTAAWSPTPVCDLSYWSVVVTSPEVLIFIFFMITDPKTIPGGRAARVMFALSLAGASTLLMAPQTTEFGAKVALLGSLALWSPLRFLFAWLAPAQRTERAGVLSLVDRLVTGTEPRGVFGRGFALGLATVVVATAILAAGTPARQALAEPSVPVVEVDVDSASLPVVEIDDSVAGLAIDIDAEFAAAIGLTLAENLAIEAEAVRYVNGGLLAGADAGLRLDEMQATIDAATATGVRPVTTHHFDTMLLRSGREEMGQSGGALVIVGTGIAETVDLDPFQNELDRHTTPFSADFVLSQIAGDRWLIVDVVPGSG